MKHPGLPFKHLQHALRNRKTTNDVDTGDKNSEYRQVRNSRVVGRYLRDGTEHDDATDSVGEAHQRSMKGCRNIPDYRETDETGEHKNGEMRHKRSRRHKSETKQCHASEKHL